MLSKSIDHFAIDMLHKNEFNTSTGREFVCLFGGKGGVVGKGMKKRDRIKSSRKRTPVPNAADVKVCLRSSAIVHSVTDYLSIYLSNIEDKHLLAQKYFRSGKLLSKGED